MNERMNKVNQLFIYNERSRLVLYQEPACIIIIIYSAAILIRKFEGNKLGEPALICTCPTVIY